ncbi:hypothetical protein V493_02113 [Pseudogymnoascus sp. VKM F-4281 (FW-2241)]|nr:hypothetical protein V493_02113 [Pseudogymnoascus sp. VKM F-4281 (FW-2241)]
MAAPAELSWSAPFAVAPTTQVTKNLPGDKILLPPSALEQLLAASPAVPTPYNNPTRAGFDPFNPFSLAAARAEASQWRDTQQQLPHPLIFRLVNPKNGRIIYAGIREFSAEEGQIGLSPSLSDALGVAAEARSGVMGEPIDLTNDNEVEEVDTIMVHAKQLPKGTYVRLRPLEAGYNPDDWKSLLERHLRENYTTLTNGEVLKIPDMSRKGHTFQFLIDKFVPEGDAICVVDTDLEVDIEALNEEQARETVKQIMAKTQTAPGTAEGSSSGSILDIWTPVQGQVLEGEYVDYELPSWDRSRTLEIEITLDQEEEVDLFVSPLAPRQRARPREDEHVFGEFDSETSSKKIRIRPTNVELEGAESLYISVHGYSPPERTNPATKSPPRRYILRAQSVEDSTPDVSTVDLTTTEDSHGPEDVQCKNCHQWVPNRTMMLHENFCLRNNILCQVCQSVFKKNSPEWQSHWHCEHDSAHGNTAVAHIKHNHIYHSDVSCPSCDYQASSIPDLALHRTTLCPGKLILCQFCHLSVPQEGDPFSPSAEALLSGLTAHELADGARTTNCHLCQAIVRLRDMTTHLKHHDLSRNSKPRPRICRNVNCGRTLDGVSKNGQVGTAARVGQGPGNELGLCSICFGPLYVSMYDPEGKAMKRRIERRYLSQLITGCGKAWCGNEVCKQGRVNLGITKGGGVVTTKDALPEVTPLLVDLGSAPMHFCVDERSQKCRKLAEMLAGEGVYELEWCVAACEAEIGELDAARQWLANWAPKKTESSPR